MIKMIINKITQIRKKHQMQHKIKENWKGESKTSKVKTETEQ